MLADELAELKRRRVQMRADNRALAVQEKNMKKRRARLLQASLRRKQRGFTMERQFVWRARQLAN